MAADTEVEPDVGHSETVLDGPKRPGVRKRDDLVRGDTIGRFVVLELLGSGGMGVVYSAYDAQLDRRVAIKLLHAVPVEDPASARTRLLREAQAMAKINHPNVIKVHEAGAFGEQVFVAMEFSDAGTLEAWLDARRRSRREIIDAFIQAGRGLAAAHAAGLVHRDFKPANVLLAKDGGVRVTDFGLVGLLASDAEAPRAGASMRIGPISESTPLDLSLTRTGAILGTPAYMAPEQFAGAVATAPTDQFAFCVSLYEALYGERPFAGRDAVEVSANVLAGNVRAAPRGVRVPSWLRRAIVRGLAVDPAARHAGMAELLATLGRDPARPWRWLLAGATGCAVAAALVLAVRSHGEVCGTGEAHVAGTWNVARAAAMKAAFEASGRPHAAASFDRATGMIDAWTSAWRLGYVDACRATRQRGEQSERLLDLRMQCLTRRLDDARATIDLLVAGGADAVDHALDALQGLPAIAACGDTAGLMAEVAPPGDPVTEARVGVVRAKLAEAHALDNLGRYARALDVARPALVEARAAGYLPVTAEALTLVGALDIDVSDAASVPTLHEAMLAATRAGDTTGMISAAAWLVYALTTQVPRFEVAQEIADLADATAEHARPGAEHVIRLDNSIGLLLATRGQAAAAQARYEQALTIGENAYGPDHPAVLSTLNQLGNLAISQTHYTEAVRWLLRVVAARERTLGKDHPAVAAALNNLGNAYRAQGKLDEAQQAQERALAIRLAALGPEHADVVSSYNNLSNIYSDRGDFATATSYLERARVLDEKLFGPDSVQLAELLLNLGSVTSNLGDFVKARPQLERALAIIEAAHGPDDPSLATGLLNLGIVAVRQHHFDEALAHYHRGHAIIEKAYGPDHRDLASFDAEIASVLRQQNKLDEAQVMAVRALAIIEKTYGPDQATTAMSLVNFGNLQLQRSDYPAGLAAFSRSLPIFEARFGDHPYTAHALMGMATALMHLKRGKEALPLLERALAIDVKAGVGPDSLATIRYNLADLLIGDPRTAARAITEARSAADEFAKSGDAESAADVRQWLRAHR